MDISNSTWVDIQAIINVPVESVWECWTTPADIAGWNFAGSDWHCPNASADLRPGGRFSYRMEARDGSMGFDFEGTFTEVETGRILTYQLDDGRSVKVQFITQGDQTLVMESFEPEKVNSIELQRAGWQAILDNFKKYTEEKPG